MKLNIKDLATMKAMSHEKFADPKPNGDFARIIFKGEPVGVLAGRWRDASFKYESKDISKRVRPRALFAYCMRNSLASKVRIAGAEFTLTSKDVSVYPGLDQYAEQEDKLDFLADMGAVELVSRIGASGQAMVRRIVNMGGAFGIDAKHGRVWPIGLDEDEIRQIVKDVLLEIETEKQNAKEKDRQT